MLTCLLNRSSSASPGWGWRGGPRWWSGLPSFQLPTISTSSVNHKLFSLLKISINMTHWLRSLYHNLICIISISISIGIIISINICISISASICICISISMSISNYPELMMSGVVSVTAWQQLSVVFSCVQTGIAQTHLDSPASRA